ncbi:MAG: roadblock/LC7 domain-containing protein [Thermoplasmata archaeon]
MGMGLEDVLVGLKEETEAIASAIVSRDGLVIASDLPEGVSAETFSIMCAAIMGAAMTTTTEMGRSAPSRILLESEDLLIVIYEADRRSMLVVVLPPEADLSRVDARVNQVVEQVAAA